MNDIELDYPLAVYNKSLGDVLFKSHMVYYVLNMPRSLIIYKVIEFIPFQELNYE